MTSFLHSPEVKRKVDAHIISSACLLPKTTTSSVSFHSTRVASSRVVRVVLRKQQKVIFIPYAIIETSAASFHCS